MKYEWQDLPERKNLFTVKNTVMINLNTGKTVRHYATNTKIAVVQKCVTPEKTYYRTYEAFHNYLNYAFEAEAFGLPNEKAPSAPSSKQLSHLNNSKKKSAPRTQPTQKNKQLSKKPAQPKGGEAKLVKKIIRKIFRRKHGNAKNS